jgi:acylphosphatase
MAMAVHECLKANVRGRVQGVGFRASVQARALKLGLTGYARNQFDGSVDVVAEGERANLETLLEYLHHGPPGARVEQLTHEWWGASGEFHGFDVR